MTVCLRILVEVVRGRVELEGGPAPAELQKLTELEASIVRVGAENDHLGARVGDAFHLRTVVGQTKVDNEIDQDRPTELLVRGASRSTEGAAVQEFEEFMAMSEEERMEKGQQMSAEERDMIMKGAAQRDAVMVDEEMTEGMTTSDQSPTATHSGSFVGVNDGIHNAEGQVVVIQLSDSSSILRLEDLKSTNGPDLYVYLSTDKAASDFINLGKLKGNMGNQNYEIPEGTDLSKYNNVLIWCRAFSVLFGSAEI